MHHVLDSLLLDHDPRLVLLAVVACIFGAASTMNVSGRVAGERSQLWLILPSLCVGATVGATHFIALLAYHAGVPTSYDIGLTALALVSGTAVMGLGFALAIRADRSASLRALGGAILGLGVVLLHYVGMAAVHLPMEVTYDPGLVTASVAFAVGFGALALTVAFGQPRPWARQTGVFLLVVMIASLHFTAMGSVRMDMASDWIAGGVSSSVLATAVAVASAAMLVIGMTGAIMDQRVSDRLAAAEADRFRALSNGASEGVVVHRDGQILDANAAARHMLSLGDRPSGRIDDWFAQSPAARWAQYPDSGSEAIEVVLRRPDGSTFPAEVTRRKMPLSDGRDGELLALRDLTARKESEARITHMALHDPVTDLPNRRLFLELGHKATSIALRGQEQLAVLVLDIDDFKLVNDKYGHDAGDAVLRAMANRIAGSLREADVAARFGGDEFTILQTSVTQQGQTIALIERLLEELQVPVSWQGREIAVGVSIGVALYPTDGSTVEQLLRNADTAMYRAKAGGKGISRFFEPQMDAALVARRSLEASLRHAVAENALTVAYQPMVTAGDRVPVAFEALLRWTDKELGVVQPADFIPVAEETGLVLPIGEFVLRQACLDAAKWPDHLRVAVNLSAAQFRRRGLVETVTLALAESGLPGDRLELEITEMLLIDNREDALRQLNQLRALGVRIAMDDFGTGFSSLSYLQAFPFDRLKIDRTFVSKLPADPQSVAIVHAVVAMGRSLGMRVVAEGVETDVQARLLKDLDCDDVQGFLIARPMVASEISEFLRSGTSSSVRQTGQDAGVRPFLLKTATRS